MAAFLAGWEQERSMCGRQWGWACPTGALGVAVPSGPGARTARSRVVTESRQGGADCRPVPGGHGAVAGRGYPGEAVTGVRGQAGVPTSRHSGFPV